MINELMQFGITDDIASSVISKYLTRKHINKDDLPEIFNPSKELLHDVYSARGSREWLYKLMHLKDDNITIIGDYDADGILSAAVAQLGLKALGIGKCVNKYVPLRTDGYGTTPESVNNLMRQFPDTTALLLTDNGVAAFDGIKRAKELGLKVLITDHHLGKEEDVCADAIVDVNRIHDDYPFKGLSGTGIIWKLLVKFAEILAPEKQDAIKSLADLVGVSVITDVMPMRNENRWFVKQALAELNHPTRLAWRSLLRILRAKNRLYGPVIDEDTIGFTIGPILNAASRVTGSPSLAYELFETNDPVLAITLSEKLVQLNETRKQTVNGLVEQIRERYGNNEFNSIADVEIIPIGYAGLIASNLTNRFQCPSVVFGAGRHDTGYLIGSARSPEWFNIVDAFDKLNKQGLIVQYGGHAGAAGLKIKSSDFKKFQAALAKIVDDFAGTVPRYLVGPDSDIRIKFNHDAIIGDYLTINGQVIEKERLLKIIHMFSKIAPFGNSFERPLTELDGVNLTNASKMGANQQHLKIRTKEIDVLKWNDEHDHDDISQDQPLSAFGTLSINEWRGKQTPQLVADKLIVDDEEG